MHKVYYFGQSQQIPMHSEHSVMLCFFLGFILGVALTIALCMLKKYKFKKIREFGERHIQLHRLNSGNNSAMEILNSKFANGEIDESEYLRKKDLLSGN